MSNEEKLEKIISLAKRRGFIFPSSEIYGGFRSSYDYGPLGTELKNNIKKLWWKDMVYGDENIVGLDSAIFMSPKIWEASGHTGPGFTDPLRECKKCHNRFRADHLDKLSTGQIYEDKCPDCGGELTEAKKFNILVKTHLGPVEDSSSQVYLRGETAQGIYVNFKNVLESSRQKIPFGIAQIGKAFRNEITPGPFTFRMREFEQMEMQFFIKPGENKKWFDFWKEKRLTWYHDLGIHKRHLKFKEHEESELAHYAKRAFDIEYEFPWGFGECEGIHDRGEWDLSNHTKYSGKDLSYFEEGTKEKYIPNIIETSAGTDRSALVFLLEAYDEDELGGERRVVLRLHKDVAPVKAAVLPLVKNNENIVKKAREIYESVKNNFLVQYDEAGSIGKRYRRQDEIGTPACITVDHQTLEDGTFTIRDRDTGKQERAKDVLSSL